MSQSLLFAITRISELIHHFRLTAIVHCGETPNASKHTHESCIQTYLDILHPVGRSVCSAARTAERRRTWIGALLTRPRKNVLEAKFEQHIFRCRVFRRSALIIRRWDYSQSESWTGAAPTSSEAMTIAELIMLITRIRLITMNVNGNKTKTKLYSITIYVCFWPNKSSQHADWWKIITSKNCIFTKRMKSFAWECKRCLIHTFHRFFKFGHHFCQVIYCCSFLLCSFRRSPTILVRIYCQRIFAWMVTHTWIHYTKSFKVQVKPICFLHHRR